MMYYIDMDTTRIGYNGDYLNRTETSLCDIRGAESGLEAGIEVFCKIFVKCRSLARYLLSLSLSLSLSLISLFIVTRCKSRNYDISANSVYPTVTVGYAATFFCRLKSPSPLTQKYIERA